MLTELTGDKAKAILDKYRVPDDGDRRTCRTCSRATTPASTTTSTGSRKVYGGKGYRVFVGKKGAMKQLPLTDVASDSAGDVFSTKTGDLRLVRNSENDKDDDDLGPGREEHRAGRSSTPTSTRR